MYEATSRMKRLQQINPEFDLFIINISSPKVQLQLIKIKSDMDWQHNHYNIKLNNNMAARTTSNNKMIMNWPENILDLITFAIRQ